MSEEEWRQAPGWGGLYEISSYGRVARIWKSHRNIRLFWIDKNGNPRIALRKKPLIKNVTIARLVAEAWHGPCPDGCEVSHLDGDTLNNSPSNLIWETHRQNCARKRDHGTILIGEESPVSKITTRDAREIKALLEHGVRATTISRVFGVSAHIINDIKRCKTWRHVSMETT